MSILCTECCNTLQLSASGVSTMRCRTPPGRNTSISSCQSCTPVQKVHWSKLRSASLKHSGLMDGENLFVWGWWTPRRASNSSVSPPPLSHTVRNCSTMEVTGSKQDSMNDQVKLNKNIKYVNIRRTKFIPLTSEIQSRPPD